MKRVDAKPDISTKNPYYISKERYYELKHFCLQYPEWKRRYKDISYYGKDRSIREKIPSGVISNPVERVLEELLYFRERMRIIEDAAERTDDILGRRILEAVTENLSYDTLNAREIVPCCRDIWYDMYRRFFYLLSQSRN